VCVNTLGERRINVQLSNSAIQVLNKRFLAKDKQGNIVETPEQLFQRVARTISGAEYDASAAEYEDRFYRIMTNLEFLPNSPTLVNSGKELGQLSACFVLPIDDSMYSIFTTLRDAALIQKSGGGVGFNFSNIRPSGDTVKSTHRCAGGPVEFIKIYDRAIEPISQGGIRRGANMAVLRCDHPNIYDFIQCKELEGTIPNFNISVGITDDFMAAVRNNRNFDLINPRSGEIVKTINACELFDSIVQHAWDNGEPGVLFLDEINRHNVVPHIGEIEATNPCVSGDSLITTTEGNIPIRDLAERGNYPQTHVYTRDENGNICIRQARFFKTKTNTKIIRLLTTRGILVCTPNHKIMTDKGYIEAQNLRPKQRIIGLNRKKHNERYLSVGFSMGKYVSESRLVAEYFYGPLDNKDVHHIDGNQYNNCDWNLEVLEHGTHSVISNIGNKNYGSRDLKNGRFIEKQGILKKRTKNPDQGINGMNWYVLGVEDAGYEDVYDGNVEDTHKYVANGILISNCGEQPLLGYESCNLGSLNLGRFVKAKQIDWERLSYVAKLAVRFLDDVIDMNKYPLPQVETRTKLTRKIGLGVMGFADMLIKMNIKYDTEEAVQMAHDVMHFIHSNALEASTELAQSRGVFPAYRGSIWCTEHGIRLRNACLTTIAPTGTLSVIANCSSGIEPYYSKTTKKHILETILEEEIEFAKEDSFITSHEISPDWHIKIQAAFQAHSDSAVSKTINFPETATLEDVKHAYMLAFKLKCKGLTIYRDKSRKKQVLTSEPGPLDEAMKIALQMKKDYGTSEELCPTCHATVIHEEGCIKCSKCDWTVCKIG
jgi:ribonucleoside-diphosphate reductase alpha chain